MTGPVIPISLAMQSVVLYERPCQAVPQLQTPTQDEGYHNICDTGSTVDSSTALQCGRLVSSSGQEDVEHHKGEHSLRMMDM